MGKPFKMERGVKYRDAAKTSIIPVKNINPDQELLPKPAWMKIKLPASSAKIEGIKNAMRKHGLHSVCEEASCPNLSECFNHGTATFMILGAICTRRCPFCDVAHGKPLPPDPDEPKKLALTIRDMNLRYVVITSVDRDDLRDGGAGHFAECVKQIRALNPHIKIETLVPDFRGKIDVALEILSKNPNLPLFVLSEIQKKPSNITSLIPVDQFLKTSVLLKQIQEKKPDLNPLHFIVNFLSMTAFPFIGKPIIKNFNIMDDEEFQKFVAERKTLVPLWTKMILNS